MSNETLDSYTYQEAFEILRGKFGYTVDEMDYLATLYPRHAYRSDIPDSIKERCHPWIHEHPKVYRVSFRPELGFFEKSFIDGYEPKGSDRFVYFPELIAKRMWSPDPVIAQQYLTTGANAGLLRWYVGSTRTFSHFKTFRVGDQESSIMWSETDEGKAYIENPNSFYLRHDIVTIERVLFNKKRDDCLKDLGMI